MGVSDIGDSYPVTLQQSAQSNLIMRAVLLISCLVTLSNAGLRCRLGGNVACTASCVALGQTSGVCDEENDCNCSEKSITLSTLEKLLPSRCNQGVKFCEATCESIGRQGGTCEQ